MSEKQWRHICHNGLGPGAAGAGAGGGGRPCGKDAKADVCEGAEFRQQHAAAASSPRGPPLPAEGPEAKRQRALWWEASCATSRGMSRLLVCLHESTRLQLWDAPEDAEAVGAALAASLPDGEGSGDDGGDDGGGGGGGGGKLGFEAEAEEWEEQGAAATQPSNGRPREGREGAVSAEAPEETSPGRKRRKSGGSLDDEAHAAGHGSKRVFVRMSGANAGTE